MLMNELYITVYQNDDWIDGSWTDIGKVSHKTEQEAIEFIKSQGYELTEHGEYLKKDSVNGDFATVHSILY